MNRGFIVVAQNNNNTDYIKCAEILSRSIKTAMPGESVTLLTDKKINNSHFDNIVIFPHGDRCQDDYWKLANDWQVYDASPYDYTIKIEADIYIPRSISYWWDILKNHDLVLCSTIRDYKNSISNSRTYRRIFDINGLPDVYNAITYFKKSQTAQHFFNIVRSVFENWSYYQQMLSTTEIATTDVVYAIASLIIGEEKSILPKFKDMSMIHMKSGINNSKLADWTNEFIFEIQSDVFRVNTQPQLYPVHYHIKDFARTLEQELYE